MVRMMSTRFSYSVASCSIHVNRPSLTARTFLPHRLSVISKLFYVLQAFPVRIPFRAPDVTVLLTESIVGTLLWYVCGLCDVR